MELRSITNKKQLPLDKLKANWWWVVLGAVGFIIGLIVFYSYVKKMVG